MITPKYILNFLLGSLLVGPSASAQDKFMVRHFGTEDGLPSNGIKGMEWDKKTQFLWMATEAGIVRYNGLSFKTFSAADDTTISNKRFLFLTRNNAGVLYFGDETGSVFRVTNNTVSFKQKGLPGINVPNNYFTLTISDQLFDHGIEGTPSVLFVPHYVSTVPMGDSSCLVLKDDSLYFYSVSLKVPEHIPLPGFAVRKGFLIDNIIFLEDAERRFFRYDHKLKKVFPVELTLDGNRSLSSGNYTMPWQNGMKFPVLVLENMAYQVRYINGRLQGKEICDVVPTGIRVEHAQYNEPAGILFLATDSRGLYIIKKHVLESMKAATASTYEKVSYYAQIELPDGNVLTDAGHVIGKNPQKMKPPIKGWFDAFVYRSGDSVIWYTKDHPQGGYPCLHKYNLRTGQITVFGKVHTPAQPVLTESSGNLYQANVQGLWKLSGDSLVLFDDRIQAATNGLPFDMKEISPGVLGIATCSTFMSYDIATKKLNTIYKSSNHCIRTFWLYKDYIFFATYGNGLYAYRNGKVKALPLDKNKYLLFTHCFVEDDYGFCWISTNRGLFKVKIDDMIAAFESDQSEVYYHYFGKDDGMTMTEMNGGCVPCALELKNKTISFPTMEGLVWVDPANAKPVLFGGNVYIDEFSVNNKRVNLDSVQYSKLDASNGEIEIRFSYTAWENPENVYISYFLDDSSAWKVLDESDASRIRFVNLRPGNHHLRIKKSNGFGINNFTYKDIRFYVTTPWYERWWFYLLSALAIVGLISLIIRLRTRQYRERQLKLELMVFEKTKELQEKNVMLEKNNTIKTRLISIINHDIITPLKFLAVTGNKLVQRKDLMSSELRDETILDMSRTSKELQTLSTNILNWIKYQNEGRGLVKDNFDLHEMSEQVIAVLEPIAHQKGMNIINDVETGTEVFQFVEPLKILLYNIVSNAVNFSDKGSVAITSDASDGHVTLSVSDEGIGMTEDQIDNLISDRPIIPGLGPGKGKGHGLGYLIIRDLLKVTGASLTIESEPGEGTIVHITFKAMESTAT